MSKELSIELSIELSRELSPYRCCYCVHDSTCAMFRRSLELGGGAGAGHAEERRDTSHQLLPSFR